MRYHAYWISPSGEIMPVETHHVTDFLRYPEVFGLTRDDVLSSYQKYGERLGIEGKAREELILGAMKKGWIRLRYNQKAQSWTAQLSGFTDRQKEYLVNWCLRMMEGEFGYKVSRLSQIKVISEKSDILFYGNFLDIGKVKSQPSQQVKE